MSNTAIDPFDLTRAQFRLPDGLVYLDGNSLGALPKATADRVADTVAQEWGRMAIGGWNRAGWMHQPRAVGDRIASLIGAPDGTVVMGDTLSIKVYQALAAGLSLSKDRSVVLSDSGNFPTDLYMAEGLLKTLGGDHRLKIVDPDAIIDALDETVAVLMLTHVDYRTGWMHDMSGLTQAAHAKGVRVIWDLAHSAGAVPVELASCGPEFAVGCTYKYLNGGPGAPAFLYCREDLADRVDPALSGWLGHAAPFAFDLEYRPGDGIDRFRVGTPPVLQMAALEPALDIFESVTMDQIRARSIVLSEAFREGVEARCPMLKLASPRDPQARGSQLSFAFEHGYAVMQALIAEGVVGDFRAPNLIRFGFAPLYNSLADIDVAVDTLARIMESGSWDQEHFHQRAAVT
ncbi:MAG: kynureninase [Pseudomonadota bacterium]